MRESGYSTRHREAKRAENADQAELVALRTTQAILDHGIYDERIANAMDDDDPKIGDDRPIETQDIIADTAVGSVREEVERRFDVLGDNYPFSLVGSELVHKPSRSGFYEFCLAISRSPSLTHGPYVDLPRSFERLSALLVRHFLGSSAKFLHVGHPRDAEVGTTFIEAMKKVNALTNEWVWNPQPDIDQPPASGDQGIDFIVWKPAPDARWGSLFIVGQCACGDNWHQKFDDIKVKKIGKWFNPLAYVEPTRAFATPFHVTDAGLRDALREGGLIFDRTRLTILAEELAQDADYSSRRATIEQLTRLVTNMANA